MEVSYMDWTRTNELAVKQKGQWSVYISNHLNYDDDDLHIWNTILNKCNPIMDIADVYSIMHGGLFFFNTEENMQEFFNIFNEDPIYSSGVYACSYDNLGNCLSENT
jgi:hypothetical protein